MHSNILWVIDIDGTLADNRHRSDLIKPPDPRWDQYFDYGLVLEDSPIPGALEHFEQGRFKHGDHVILTARPERSRSATEAWLHRHQFVVLETRILMKPDMIRHQRASIFKPAALSVLAEDNPTKRIILVEDHPDVLQVLKGTQFGTRTAPQCWTDESCWR